ncbi:MAG TPA: quinone-dependent dihydroorotate dehydrogenase [Candidatus Saccharimonadales bacterium]|nr:quinone-dependent dihydroorotate dehydrogenase [Candidatus Saccharimonadales bacterium]
MMLRNRIEGFYYRNAVRPAMFLLDPEVIHERMVGFGRRLGSRRFTRASTKLAFGFKDPKLGQTVAGIRFSNPVGLAAGFDKDGELGKILPMVGFGYGEFGSITRHPYGGNPRPWLARLKGQDSLIVHYGLKNDGVDKILPRLKQTRDFLRENKIEFPIGVSVAAASPRKDITEVEILKDVAQTFAAVAAVADYITLNISCPNIYNSPDFLEPKNLENLLLALPLAKTKQPIFLKLSPDMDDEQLEKIVRLAEKYGLAGFVAGNLTKDRSGLKNPPIPGGLSGKIVRRKSDQLIGKLARLNKNRLIIIGCGGIFSAEDAYRKIRLGASLLQLITGMIYQGPQVISEINWGLAKLLERDGFISIQEAVGVDIRR